MSTNKKLALVFLWIVSLFAALDVGLLIQQHLDRGKSALTAQEADRIYAEGFAWGEAEGRAKK